LLVLVPPAFAGCAAIAPPLTVPEVAGFAKQLEEEVHAPMQPPTGSIDVEQAVARAVAVNHAVRAKELEAALAEAKAVALGGGLLPELVAESSYFRRDRPPLSRSSHSATYATSTGVRTLTHDLTLSWNILDLGLSYIRARQGVHRAHQQHEEVRRIRARIGEETRLAFWRTVALDTLEPRLARLDPEIREALALADSAGSDGRLDPAISISQQREILNLQRELNQIHASIAGARHELRLLTGLQGATRLRLERSRRSQLARGPMASPAEDVAVALRQRAEIRQHLYDLRITEDEVDATILQLLPGATLRLAGSSDANPFLLHSHWVGWGATIAGNLMRLAHLEADLDVTEQQHRVHRQAALATAATIVLQVHVARARMTVERRAHRDAARFAAVQRQLYRQVRAGVEVGRLGAQAQTREKLALLLAEVRETLSYAELQAAAAAHASSRGDELGAPKGGAAVATAPSARRMPARIAEAGE
jgi:outer membrane protein TolC